MVKVCGVDGCEKLVRSRGWCGMHYTRWRKRGSADAPPLRPAYAGKQCGVDDCNRPASIRGWCNKHYSRWLRHGDPLMLKNREMGTGSYSTSGYHVTHIRKDGTRKNVFTHRLIMERALGRPLHVDEHVHHINGNRADNRLENLELWTTAHPSGQRPEDLVAFAEEILARYGRAAQRPRLRAVS